MERKLPTKTIYRIGNIMTSSEAKEVGSYMGFKLYLSFSSFEKNYQLTLKTKLLTLLPLDMTLTVISQG